MISLNWADGGDWDYAHVCIYNHSAPGSVRMFSTWTVKLWSCQTQEKTNKPDSGCIYILLCNSFDLFFVTICAFMAESKPFPVNITILLIYFVKDYSILMNTCPVAGAAPADKLPA